MKKLSRQIKEEFKKKLTADVMVHFSGLKKQDLKKMNKTVERKLDSIANFYITLLKKKGRKKVTPAMPFPAALEPTPMIAETNTVENNVATGNHEHVQ
jgi:hypothetical protein